MKLALITVIALCGAFVGGAEYNRLKASKELTANEKLQYLMASVMVWGSPKEHQMERQKAMQPLVEKILKAHDSEGMGIFIDTNGDWPKILIQPMAAAQQPVKK